MMPFVRTLLVLLLSAGLAAGARAERPAAPEIIGGTESLSVRAVAQDSHRQVWFGTDKGLYRFDGYAPTFCSDRDGGKDHFQINGMVCLEDRVLLGTIDGLVEYDCMEGRFSIPEVLAGKEVFALFRQGDTVWIGSEAGLYRYGAADGACSAVPLDTRLDIRSVTVAGDRLVLGTRRPAEVRVYSLESLAPALGYTVQDFNGNIGSVDALRPYGADRLLAGTSGALFELGLELPSVRRIADFNWVKALYARQDSLLVATDNGLFSCNIRDGKASRRMNNVVWAIFEDAGGNCWYGSDTGLLLSGGERLIRPLEVAPRGASNLLSAISGDGEGTIYAGGSYGLLAFGNSPEPGVPRWYRMADPVHPIAHNKIRQIKRNPYDGTVWALTAAGTVRLDPSDGQFKRIPAQSLLLANAFDILFQEDCFWVASFTGLNCFQRDSLVDSVTAADGLSSNQVVQLAGDRSGRIWLRTQDRNLYRYDPGNRNLAPFLPDGGAAAVWDLIYADPSGDLWAVAGNRLCKIRGTGEGAPFDAEYLLPGFAGTEVSALIKVENMLWACSPEGIAILDETSGKIRLIHAEAQYVSMYYDRPSAQVYLGGLDRIDVAGVRDAAALLDQRDAGIRVTRVGLGDGQVIPAREYADGILSLPSSQNNLYVWFSDFDYAHGGTRRLQFNLDGSPERWFEAGGEGNRAFLPDLSPGRHRLFASAGGNVAGELLLTIRILRPWYASPGAFLLYALLAALLVFLAVRLSQVRKRMKEERRQKAEEMAQIRDEVRVELISTPMDEGEMSADERLLDRITRIIEARMENPGFSVSTLCELSGHNEKYLYRKIKRLTGLSTVEYIRSIRLKKAARLLENDNFSVSEVMYMVGFTNSSYFSRTFAARFGKTPKEYRRQRR